MTNNGIQDTTQKTKDLQRIPISCVIILQLKAKLLIDNTPTVFNCRYGITLILSLYRNWYLYSTVNDLLMQTGNKQKYLNVQNFQSCNLLVCTNAIDSCFCCYFLNVKNFDKAEDTTSKCETKQTNMSANMEKKNRNSDNRNSIEQTSVKKGER